MRPGHNCQGREEEAGGGAAAVLDRKTHHGWCGDAAAAHRRREHTERAATLIGIWAADQIAAMIRSPRPTRPDGRGNEEDEETRRRKAVLAGRDAEVAHQRRRCDTKDDLVGSRT